MKYVDTDLHTVMLFFLTILIWLLCIKINLCLNIVNFSINLIFFSTAFHSSVSHLACCRHTWSFGVSSWLSCVKCFDNIIYICLCCPWNSCINWHSCELCCTTRLEIHFKKCYYLFLIVSSNWDTWWYVLEN